MIISNQQELKNLIDKIPAHDCVGLDTEFVWEKTYFPQIGLVQVGLSEEECYLIDVLALDDLSPLGEVLSNPKIVKILHDAPQDLDILERLTGHKPKNVFDTRLAARFMNMTSTLSLALLIKELVGITLDKTSTRSDWLKRPLSEKQINYALNDVRYLGALREIFLYRLKSKDRKVWLEEELALYDNEDLYGDSDPRLYFMRVKGVGRLKSKELAYLRELAAWRESLARERDKPRQRILTDETLMDLSIKNPSDLGTATIRKFSKKDFEVYGDAIQEVLATANALSLQDYPAAVEKLPDQKPSSAQADLILAFIKGKSLRIGIDPSLVCSRAEVLSFIRAYKGDQIQNHFLAKGWRGQFVGDDLMAVLEGKKAIRLGEQTGLPMLVGISES